MAPPVTFLLDNGSLEPAATLGLRRLAAQLAERVDCKVEPVSLLHSSAISPELLEGIAAEIFEPALAKQAAMGVRDVVVVPLFFGPSRALTHYLPERVRAVQTRFPDLRVRLAPTLFAEGDDRLAGILADHVRAVATLAPQPRIALVDHGSPVPEVTAVRDSLAAQLSQLLGVEVVGCCMERRPEPEYDFNGLLLEQMLRQPVWTRGEVVVAMQFLLPGRHAGPTGDVATICAQAVAERPDLRVKITPLVGAHATLVEILRDRWRAACPPEAL